MHPFQNFHFKNSSGRKKGDIDVLKSRAIFASDGE